MDVFHTSFSLEDLIQQQDHDPVWSVLHTRPRAEKKLMMLFRERGISTYTPLETRIHRYGNRERENTVPVFSGYVFCAHPEERSAWIQQNQYVANRLPVENAATLLDQLRHIDHALREGQAAEVYNYVVQGQTVRIRSGRLKGVEGVVTELKPGSKVVLNLEMIQKSVAMEVDINLLEPIY